jgi:hypothetical protein
MMTTPRGTLEDRIESAKATLLAEARAYGQSPSPETWSEICRAKATLDALRRCAR